MAPLNLFNVLKPGPKFVKSFLAAGPAAAEPAGRRGFQDYCTFFSRPSQYGSRKAFFVIFPEPVLGSSLRKSTLLGAL